MEEVTIQQLEQEYTNLSFLVKHHEELSKHYTRQLFNIELNIQNLLKKQSSEPNLSVEVEE